MQDNHITLPQILKIGYFSGCGNSQRLIASKTGTSKSSVNRYLMNIEEKTSYKIDYKTQIKYHYVLFKVLQNPFITNLQISKSMKDFEFKTSESSVSRIATSLKIRNKFQKPKEKLGQKQKEYRVKFAKNIMMREDFFPTLIATRYEICRDKINKTITLGRLGTHCAENKIGNMRSQSYQDQSIDNLIHIGSRYDFIKNLQNQMMIKERKD